MIDLESAREELGVTKSELARRTGIPVRDIRRIENTPGYDPRFSRVMTLADGLGVPVDRLRPRFVSHTTEAATPQVVCGPTRDTDQPASTAVSPVHPGE